MQEQETRSKRAQLIQAMQLLKPNPTSLAYALFVASNATIIWGGSFPFLPLTFQTKAMTTSFFLAQALAFSACFAAVLVSLLLRKPGNVVHKYRFTLIPAAPYLLGWACLIAAMYIPQGSRALGIAGGAFTGFGAAGLMLVWVRLFCAKPRRYGAGLITQSLLYAPIIYWLLTAIPTAIAVFLMPSVVTPLILLALMLESRDTEFTGPMFQRVPREEARTYLRVFQDYWRLALCIATFGFACGVMRSLVIADASMGSAVNNISMAGSLICAGIFFYVWNYRTARFNAGTFYRCLFPFVVLGFFLLPYGGESSNAYPIGFAGALYAIYSVCFALIVIQCGQAARARGVSPLFMFCTVGGIVYLAHDLGFISGQFAERLTIPGADELASIALVAIFIMTIMYYVGQGGWKAATSPNQAQVEHVELIASAHSPESRHRASAGDQSGNAREILDKISKGCKAVAEQFALSEREAEVMELIVRGHTVNRIAEELLVSVNTVRTHSKRLYAKLDVHKKQQLRDLVERYTP